MSKICKNSTSQNVKKINYREQITEYDCGPTAFVNALIYLFKRSDIPSLAIRHIYKDTLDRPSVGSSFDAMTRLTKWLRSYKKENFSLEAQIIKKDDVVFEGHFLTTKALCGVLFVYFDRTYGHFITVIYEKGEYIYCFDPYLRVEKRSKNGLYDKKVPEKQVLFDYMTFGYLKSSASFYLSGLCAEKSFSISIFRLSCDIPL